MTQPLFLVGARGCGKTTSGKCLAAALNLRFIDTDHWLQSHSTMSVADIVALEGWAGFRARESQALHAVTAEGTVVATGGGMVLAAENRRLMNETGTVIYLCAPADILAQRLEASPEDSQRPTLTGRSVTDEVAEILAARDALYREVAHHIIDATLPCEQVVERIVIALNDSSSRSVSLDCTR